MIINDDNFITEIKKKNPKALDFVVDTYSNLTFKIVSNVLNSNFHCQDVEECVNDVFLAVWNNIESFDELKGVFKYWISAIAKYKSIDYKRKLGKTLNNESIDNFDFQTDSNIESLVISKENKDELLDAISTMKSEDKEIFIRRYFLDETIESIAKEFDVNRNLIDKKLSRGRKFLKEKLNFFKKEAM